MLFVSCVAAYLIEFWAVSVGLPKLSDENSLAPFGVTFHVLWQDVGHFGAMCCPALLSIWVSLGGTHMGNNRLKVLVKVCQCLELLLLP
jgi:hypothetical protein